MGSTGDYWKCPWCGRKGTPENPVRGYAFDETGYPICVGRAGGHTCADKFLEGLTRNGVRAGALFKILKRHDGFFKIQDQVLSIYLDISDYLYGTHREPRSRPLRYGWTRLNAWLDFYRPVGIDWLKDQSLGEPEETEVTFEPDPEVHW